MYYFSAVIWVVFDNLFPHSDAADHRSRETSIQDTDAHTSEFFVDAWIGDAVFGLPLAFKMLSRQIFAENRPR